MPPSITFWNRLEPRPRSPSIAETLAAKIRDPLWMLTRQWQFGEFQGEDAASPAYIKLSTKLAPLVGWRAKDDQEFQPISGEAPSPLEEMIESEPFSPNLLLRVEIGQVFETLLNQTGVPAVQELIDGFRERYPIPLIHDDKIDYLFDVAANIETDLNTNTTVPQTLREAFNGKKISISSNISIWVKKKGKEWLIADNENGQNYAIAKDSNVNTFRIYLMRDQESVRFLRVCAGRAIDGVDLYQTYKESLSSASINVKVDTATWSAAMGALSNLKKWVEDIFGDIDTKDPKTWKPERLEYGVEVIGTTKDRQNNVLSAYPGRDGDFDWHSFDQRPDQKPITGISPGTVESKDMSVLPMHVRFRGMPNARWWDFENNKTDFGDIRPDKRDLAKLIMMDFMLVHGNDWFVIPFDQSVGTLCWIDSLMVHDVFGDRTLIKRSEQLDGTPNAGERWTMFSISLEDKPNKIADFFLLPLSAASAAQKGPTIEEVRFLRDEMANMVWAVEHTIENGIGRSWSGHERDLAAKPVTPAAPASTGSGGNENKPLLRYKIQTSVPVNWIPFLPVLVEPAKGKFALEKSAMVDLFENPILPIGRILQPTKLSANTPYWIQEEEVPRTGTRITRVICRSRWIDGSTYLWIARRKMVGMGEGSSGLRFDIIEPS